jgi:hypothetical protein
VRIHRSKDLLGLSATTFLLLCIWLGPNLACFLIAVVALLAAWFALCRRYPAVAWSPSA